MMPLGQRDIKSILTMDTINWGIIGCGDVTELKSGPAFNKVPGSKLIAVMRRDAAKAADYALRHHVPKWYADAAGLIHDPEVHAIYIATPPSTHEEFAIAAFNAGKPVYLEKPMTLNAAEAQRITEAANEKKLKLVVAHYRREQPRFKKMRALLAAKAIGDIRTVRIEYFKKLLSAEELKDTKTAWRVTPSLSGGGLFNDLAPHQLDLMHYFFGDVEKANGVAVNQSGLYQADDMVAGNILFKSGVTFSGTWCFNAPEGEEKDLCEIIGSTGKISFSVFTTNSFTVTINGEAQIFVFDELQHVQQPMIQSVVNYFAGNGYNPCSGEEGTLVMQLIDEFTKR